MKTSPSRFFDLFPVGNGIGLVSGSGNALKQPYSVIQNAG